MRANETMLQIVNRVLSDLGVTNVKVREVDSNCVTLVREYTLKRLGYFVLEREPLGRLHRDECQDLQLRYGCSIDRAVEENFYYLQEGAGLL